MATVQMNRFAAEAGRMPPVCICCGAPAQQHVRHTFHYQPTWLVLFYILIPALLRWYLSSNPATVTVPVCAAHRNRLQWPKFVRYALAGGLLLMVPLLFAASMAGWHTAMGAMMLLVLLWLIALWAASVIVALTTPRAEHYTTSHVTLTAVAPAFAHSLQAGGGAVPPAVQPLPGLAGSKTGGGLSQGMFAVLILGGGFVALLALGFVLGFASYYVRKAGRGGRQEVAQRPMAPPAWAPPNIGPPTIPPPAPHRFGGNDPRLPDAPPDTLTPPPEAVDHSMPSPADALSPSNPGPPRPPRFRPPGGTFSDEPWPPRGRNLPTPPRRGRPTFAPGGASETTEEGSMTPASSADSNQNQTENARQTSNNASSTAPASEQGFGKGTRPVAGPSPPPGSMAVTPATPLEPGTQVWHLWGNRWYPAEVLFAQGEQVKIHYYNYSSTFDEEVPRSELRLPHAPSPTTADSLAADSSAASSSAEAAIAADNGPPNDRDVRTWTDSTGKFTIEATLLEFADGKVKLERTDGRIVTLPFEKLSAADQQFVEAMNP